MTEKEYLTVWHEKRLVGKLWQNPAGVIGFCYEEDWIRDGFAISQQLPLGTEEYSPESAKAHRFFANLLPEEGARIHIIHDLKISNTDYELLKAIGGECAGAFSVLPSTQQPSDHFQYQKLTAEDLEKLLLRKGYFFINTTNKHYPRLSLAGAQDKCPVFYDGKDYLLPQDAAPSTHILKFEIAGYRNVPAYEYFLTKLAKLVGLPVVDIQLCKKDSHYYLLVKRYDRIVTRKQQIRRLHQEDFCQALGFDYANKYQRHGGPSFKDCYDLVQRVSTKPFIDTGNLLRWQIFNVLAGNSDGHAKNLSLIYNSDNLTELAPFYDLVCTRAIERIDSELALSVGGEFNPDNLSLKHWGQLAIDCDVRKQYLITMLQEMSVSLLEALPTIYEEFESLFGPYPALQRITKVIRKQCRRINSFLYV